MRILLQLHFLQPRNEFSDLNKTTTVSVAPFFGYSKRKHDRQGRKQEEGVLIYPLTLDYTEKTPLFIKEQLNIMSVYIDYTCSLCIYYNQGQRKTLLDTGCNLECNIQM